MSAYICTDSHINALATLASLARIRVYRNQKFVVDCQNQEQFTAETLLTENAKSVNYRYEGDKNDPTITYRCEARFLNLPAVEVIKLCNCYDYQACEHPEYEASAAAGIVDALRKHYINELPGYDAAPWGLDEAAADEPVCISLSSMITTRKGRRA